MKRLLNILILFSLGVALFSCAKDEVESPADSKVNQKNFHWSPGIDDLEEGDLGDLPGQGEDSNGSNDNEDDPEDINDDGDDEDEDRNPDRN